MTAKKTVGQFFGKWDLFKDKYGHEEEKKMNEEKILKAPILYQKPTRNEIKELIKKYLEAKKLI